MESGRIHTEVNSFARLGRQAPALLALQAEKMETNEQGTLHCDLSELTTQEGRITCAQVGFGNVQNVCKSALWHHITEVWLISDVTSWFCLLQTFVFITDDYGRMKEEWLCAVILIWDMPIWLCEYDTHYGIHIFFCKNGERFNALEMNVTVLSGLCLLSLQSHWTVSPLIDLWFLFIYSVPAI